jgi:hypothetical protein
MRRAAHVFLLLAVMVAFLVPRSREARAVAGVGQFTRTVNPSPGDVSDIVMWLRADQVVSPSNGVKFSQWRDLVNGGITYSQFTSGRQFVWNASDSAFGGQPSVTSSASSEMDAAQSVAAPFTFYCVFDTTTPSAYQILLTDASDVQESGFTGGGYYYYSPSSGNGTVTTGAHAGSWIHNGTSGSAIYVDSSASPVGTSGVTTSTSAVVFTVGYNGGIDGLLGNEAEIIVYKVAHTAAQVGAVFTYFGQRYGQTWH